DTGLAGAVGKPYHRVVEGAILVHRFCERFAAHPQHAEQTVVRHELTWRDGVHVLRRQRDTDDVDGFATAVDRCCDRVADVQAVRLGKALQHDRFVTASWPGSSPTHQVYLVHRGLHIVRQ